MNKRFYLIFPVMLLFYALYFTYPTNAASQQDFPDYPDYFADYGRIYAEESLNDMGYDTNRLSLESVMCFSNFSYIPYDADSDGIVTLFDLILVKNHLLGRSFLSSDAILRVTGLEDPASVNIIYLLMIKDFILGSQIPEQAPDYSVLDLFVKSVFFSLCLIAGMLIFKNFTDNWNHIGVTMKD